MADLTIREIIKLSPEQRKSLYQVNNLANKNIDKVTIDGNLFTDYSAFSFLMEKTYVKSPQRTSNGSIPDMETYAWFLTPHLKVDFSLMSIDSYRKLMKLIRSKNEFTVTCYDVVSDKDVTHKMYFATEQMPKLWSIARALDGNNTWVELLGVNSYTIELIGTNTSFEEHTITYHLNIPRGAEIYWGGDIVTTQKAASHFTSNLAASFKIAETNPNSPTRNVNEITFDGNWKFRCWAENEDGSGFKYMNNQEYLITDDLTLYAIWDWV